MTAFAAFGGILFGYDTGIINGVKEMRVGPPSDCFMFYSFFLVELAPNIWL